MVRRRLREKYVETCQAGRGARAEVEGEAARSNKASLTKPVPARGPSTVPADSSCLHRIGHLRSQWTACILVPVCMVASHHRRLQLFQCLCFAVLVEEARSHAEEEHPLASCRPASHCWARASEYEADSIMKRGLCICFCYPANQITAARGVVTIVGQRL